MPLLEGNASPGPRSSRFFRSQRFGSSSTTAKAGMKKNHSSPSGNGCGTSPFFFSMLQSYKTMIDVGEPASLYLTRQSVGSCWVYGWYIYYTVGWVNRNHISHNIFSPLPLSSALCSLKSEMIAIPEGFPRISSAPMCSDDYQAWFHGSENLQPSHTIGSQRSRVPPKPGNNDIMMRLYCGFGTKWSNCGICWVFSRLQIGWDVLVESWEPNHWRHGGGQQSKLPMPANFDDIDIIDIVIFNKMVNML